MALRKRKQKKAGRETDVNLTPVLSIAFILMLFFIAAVPIARERGFHLLSPARDSYCKCSEPVVIRVDSDNRIFVKDGDRQREVDISAVRTFVARHLAEFPKDPVLIQAHRNSDMGIVLRVLDQARQASNPPPAVSIASVDS